MSGNNLLSCLKLLRQANGVAVVGAAAAAVVLSTAAGALAQPIPPGIDCFETTDGSSGVVFGSGGADALPEIPAYFFGPGSDPFEGIIALRGEPLGGSYPGDVSTVVERLDAVTMPGPATVQVEMVELSLVSVAPIRVTYWDETEESFFDVFVTLSDETTSTGYMRIWETEAGVGGEYDFISTSGGGIAIHPKFVFTRTEPPYDSFTLEEPQYDVLLENDTSWPNPTWQYEEPALVCYHDNGFYPVPGLEVLALLNGGDAGGHGVIPPQEQVDGCCLPDGTCIDVLPSDCIAQMGTPQGIPCAGTTIACCLSGGACSDVDPVCCDDLGGVPSPTGTPACLGDSDDDGTNDACDAKPDCVVPDPGTGTPDLPPEDCDYIGPDELHEIIEGLPPGTTIELDPIHMDFINVVTTNGGTLGGEIERFDSTLDLTVSGTGSLSEFSRHLAVPISCEVHTGPRNPGDPVQTFPNDMYRLDGQLFGDPDFCTFIVRGGSDYDLPSPGQTTATELPSGDYAVDSFFDITYQIQFEGCLGSQLEDYMGTTTAKVFMATGNPPTETEACCYGDGSCRDLPPEVCTDMAQGPGTACQGDSNTDGIDDACPDDPCIVPDNGTGTVDLPPEDCDYLSPEEVHQIIDGLPPGTTIELDPIHMDFINVVTTNGGTLGGEIEFFDSTLDLTVSGTGDLAGFNRHLAVPISCEAHTGPRNPGDPVQEFDNDMYRLDGELFGDPDFCELIVRGGTDYGLPGPGHTTLTELPSGDFAVDSFFDITYQIEFEGCPGSQLADYSGVTTATIRMTTDRRLPPEACCYSDGTCRNKPPYECTGMAQGPGTVCLGDADSNGIDDACPDDPCIVPDNGSGTASLPPEDCEYVGPDEVHEIIDGLPPGTTIELDPIHLDFINVVTSPGGTLGGEIEWFDSTLELDVSGTGDLAGFSRYLAVPISCEVHTGPRNPGDPVQQFENDMFRLDGQLFGDPDFCTFIVRGGTDYGLPGPGGTTLTELPDGYYAVDSFFDITYQIEFEGCPDSALADYSGTTTATIRMMTDPRLECGPAPGGAICLDIECPVPTDQCLPRCVNHNPATGQNIVTDCQCQDPQECHVDLASGDSSNPCSAPDDGTGTVRLPPEDCEYLSPDEVHEIIDGLPPGATIELDPIHLDFINIVTTNGGTLGGEIERFDSTLELDVSGTGSLAGFNRYILVPISCEVHTGPRNPGDPVQDFDNDMYRLDGQLFGDPDFCTFIVTGGTDYGLPGPGHTKLTELPSGDFAVDSFFDITYQIEFEGCPDSQLADYAGTTTATIRMQTGFVQPPTCTGGCPPGMLCGETFTPNPDGTTEICCDCRAPEPKWIQRPHEPQHGFGMASDLWWNEPGTAIKRAQPAVTPAAPRVPSEPQMTNTGEEAVPVFAGHVLTVTGDRGTGILYAPTQSDNPTFRAAVSAITGEPCDYFDARVATPTVAQMLQYSCVFTWINYACANPVQFGDNLADYVDAGGRVILGQWCYHTTQTNWLQGRIMTPAYCPITAGGLGTSGTYAGDGVTCIHDGVIAYSTSSKDHCTLVAGALSDGTFTDGWLSVGYWPDYSVFYSAGNTGWDLGSTGDWDLLVANMCACSDVNQVVSDDFISDGRPIMAVRWWGSYLDPIYEPEQAAEPHTIDGWFISFHHGDPAITYPGCPPDAEAGDDPTVLGLYFAPVDAVQIVNLGYQDCLHHTVYEYTVDLEQCCLLCAEVDPRTGSIPANVGAFREETELHYWLGIQAVVGVTWFPPCCCSYDDQTLTGHLPSDITTNGHFWGWHTSPAQDMRNGPLWGACTGRIMNPGPYTLDNCWDYHEWDVPLWECPAEPPPNQIDMAFELVAPPWPVFSAVSSCRYHCKPKPCATGELCLDIGLGTQAWNGLGAVKDPNVEPRLGGAEKLKLQMSQDMDPNTVHGGNVQVDCYVSGPYGGAISAMPGATASEVVLLFSGALPEQDCCRIDLAGMTSTVGDAVTDAYFIGCLEGDVNRDFAVSTADTSSVKQRLEDEVTDANQQYDFNTDRMMSTADRSSIKQRLGRLMPQCP